MSGTRYGGWICELTLLAKNWKIYDKCNGWLAAKESVVLRM